MYHTLVPSNKSQHLHDWPLFRRASSISFGNSLPYIQNVYFPWGQPDAGFGEHNEIIMVSVAPTLVSEIHFLLNAYNVS